MIALGWLLVGHAVADFPLQGDFLAKAKNHRAPIHGVPWAVCLVMHAVVCAGAVAVVLSWQYAVAEFVVHTVTDYLKNDGVLGDGEVGFVVDQAVHVAWKIVWVLMSGALPIGN